MLFITPCLDHIMSNFFVTGVPAAQESFPSVKAGGLYLYGNNEVLWKRFIAHFTYLIDNVFHSCK